MIENITEYTKDILKEYIKIATKRTRIITYVSSAIILACSIIQFLFLEIIIGSFFLLLGLGFLITNIFMVTIALKKSTVMTKLKNNYEFFPESVTITTFSQDKELGKSTIPYSAITKILEIKDLILLYINKNQAIIINCKNFVNAEDKEIVKRYIENNQIKL